MKIPLFPLDVVLFPGAPLPLHIFEERYREMVGACLHAGAEFGVVRAQRDGLAVIGCTAAITRVLHRYPDGRVDIFCEGRHRFEIELLDNTRRYLQAEVDFFTDDGEESTREEREECAALHFEVLELAGVEFQTMHLDLDHPVSFQLAASLPSDPGFKQQLLNSRSDAERTARLRGFYNTMLPKLHRGIQTSRAAGRNGHIM